MSDHIENRFTLVYGTWGSKSKWTKQGSTFRTLLTAASGSRCSFRRCTWTGANRQADRVLAVEKLRRRLTNQFKTSKNVRHFVVAHSHGGNIALTTALAPEIGSRLSGVVCLNTPFLVTVERTLLYLMVTLVFLALLPFPISILRNAATMPHVPPVGEWQLTVFWLKMNWPVLTASLIPFFLLVALTPRRSWPVLRKNEPRAVPTDSLRCPVLCLRTAGDEAFGGLGLLEGLVELPHALLHPVSIILVFVATTLMVGLNWLSPMVISNPTDRRGGWLDLWSGALSTGLLYTDLVIAVALVGSVVVGSAVRSFSLGLGARHVLQRADLASRSTVSLVPLNARDVTFVEIREGENWGWLSHSAIYDDKAVVQEIWRWCEERGTDTSHSNNSTGGTNP